MGGQVDAIAAASRSVLEVYGRAGVLLVGAHHGIVVVATGAGLWLLAAGRIGPGALLAAVGYSHLALSRASDVLDNGFFHFAMTRVHAARLTAVLDEQPAAPEPPRPVARPAGPGEVRLHGVSVGDGDDRVLDGVDLVLPAGSTTALVGESGAGKSTIAALVGRLLDPDRGQVTIDGTDVAQLARADLAALVGYAFERPALLGATLRDAIALGTDATDDAVRAAARVARADAFIARLPREYDTPLAEAPLSGGEHQRLGLARLALRRPRVMVLDDALSSLDTATEAEVFAAIRRLGEGRTLLVVAHRAATAARADRVAWLVDGRIAAVAPHHVLWEDEAYRDAFSTATRGPSPGHAQV